VTKFLDSVHVVPEKPIVHPLTTRLTATMKLEAHEGVSGGSYPRQRLVTYRAQYESKRWLPEGNSKAFEEAGKQERKQLARLVYGEVLTALHAIARHATDVGDEKLAGLVRDAEDLIG